MSKIETTSMQECFLVASQRTRPGPAFCVLTHATSTTRTGPAQSILTSGDQQINLRNSLVLDTANMSRGRWSVVCLKVNPCASNKGAKANACSLSRIILDVRDRADTSTSYDCRLRQAGGRSNGVQKLTPAPQPIEHSSWMAGQVLRLLRFASGKVFISGATCCLNPTPFNSVIML